MLSVISLVPSQQEQKLFSWMPELDNLRSSKNMAFRIWLSICIALYITVNKHLKGDKFDICFVDL